MPVLYFADRRASLSRQAQVASAGREWLGQGDSLGVGPIGLEPVNVADWLVEDVHHYVVIIQRDPVAEVVAFYGKRGGAFAIHALLDAAADGLHLHVRAAGRDHEIVGD